MRAFSTGIENAATKNQLQEFIVMKDHLNQTKLQISERIDALLKGYVKGELSESDLDELSYLLRHVNRGFTFLEEVAVDKSPLAPLSRQLI